MALIARLQIGNQSGVLDMIEGVCRSNFAAIDEVCGCDFWQAMLVLVVENGDLRGQSVAPLIRRMARTCHASISNAHRSSTRYVDSDADGNEKLEQAVLVCEKLVSF